MTLGFNQAHRGLQREEEGGLYWRDTSSTSLMHFGLLKNIDEALNPVERPPVSFLSPLLVCAEPRRPDPSYQ